MKTSSKILLLLALGCLTCLTALLTYISLSRGTGFRAGQGDRVKSECGRIKAGMSTLQADTILHEKLVYERELSFEDGKENSYIDSGRACVLTLNTNHDLVESIRFDQTSRQ